MLDGGATEKLAEAAGATEAEAEVGVTGMEPERVAQMEADLKQNPPRPFDLTRRLTVFVTEVQFIELRFENATFGSRRIRLPPSFQKLEDEALRRNIDSSLKIPIDLTTKLDISIKSHRGDETLKVNEARPFARSGMPGRSPARQLLAKRIAAPGPFGRICPNSRKRPRIMLIPWVRWRTTRSRAR